MRAPGSRFFLRNANDEHMRYISMREGEAAVASGQYARIVKKQHGKPTLTLGYKLCVTIRPADPGGPTLRHSEAIANSGVYGQSYTSRLHELDKMQHVRRTRYASGVEVETPETEDFIELAEAKVDIWALTGDTKAIRVGPRPDAAAIAFAEKLDMTRRLYPAPEQA